MDEFAQIPGMERLEDGTLLFNGERVVSINGDDSVNNPGASQPQFRSDEVEETPPAPAAYSKPAPAKPLINSMTELSSVQEVANMQEVIKKDPVLSMEEVISQEPVFSQEEVISQEPLKTVQEVIATPLKSVQEILSMKEVIKKIPLTDEVVKKWRESEGKGVASDYSDDSEPEAPARGYGYSAPAAPAAPAAPVPAAPAPASEPVDLNALESEIETLKKELAAKKMEVKKIEEVLKKTEVLRLEEIQSIREIATMEEIQSIEEVISKEQLKKAEEVLKKEEVLSQMLVKSMTPVTKVEEIVNIEELTPDQAKRLLAMAGDADATPGPKGYASGPAPKTKGYATA